MTPSNVPTQQAMDLLAMDHLPQCPTCDDLAPAGATRCECGQSLLPRAPKLPRLVLADAYADGTPNPWTERRHT